MAYRCRNACTTIYDCELPHAVNALKGWSQITYGVIGVEKCPDTGRMHLQCYFEFRNSMRQSTFTNRLQKPVFYFKSRYKKAKAADCATYCKKDGLCLEWGEMSKNEGHRSDLEDILECIREGMSERELAEHYCDSFARYMKWAQRMIVLFGSKGAKARYSLQSCCDNLQTAPIMFEQQGWEHTALVCGPAGSGKTQYALAHFQNPLLVRHLDKLTTFDPKYHDGIVFDDMVFDHWPVTSQIHLLDWHEPSDMHCRYMCGHIPAHTKKIVCCNPNREPFTNDPAINSRLYRVDIQGEAPCRRKELKHPTGWGPLDKHIYFPQNA